MTPPLLLRAPSQLKAAARITMGRRDLEHHDEATRPMTGVDFGDNRDLAKRRRRSGDWTAQSKSDNRSGRNPNGPRPAASGQAGLGRAANSGRAIGRGPGQHGRGRPIKELRSVTTGARNSCQLVEVLRKRYACWETGRPLTQCPLSTSPRVSTLVYLAIRDKFIEGSLQSAISTVPVMP